MPNPNIENVMSIPHPNCCGGMPCADCKPILDAWSNMTHEEWLASVKSDNELGRGSWEPR